MSKQSRFIEQDVINYLADLGYVVTDLNDNPHGLRVRGPNWTVTAPGGQIVGCEWIAVDAWESARKHNATILWQEIIDNPDRYGPAFDKDGNELP